MTERAGTDEYIDHFGFDPTPGDVWNVRHLANAVEASAHRSHDADQVLKQVGGNSSFWHGKAATMFSSRMGELAGYLGRVADATNSVGNALQDWETELAALQRQAAALLDEAREAKKLSMGLRSSCDRIQHQLDTKGIDDATLAQLQSALNQAERLLEDANMWATSVNQKAHRLAGDHHTVASAVAARISQASVHAPPEPNVLEKFIDAVASTAADAGKELAQSFAALRNVLGDIATILAIASLAAAGLVAVGALATFPPGLAAAGVYVSALGLSSQGTAAAMGTDVDALNIVSSALGTVSLGAGRLAGKAVTVVIDGASISSSALANDDMEIFKEYWVPTRPDDSMDFILNPASGALFDAVEAQEWQDLRDKQSR